MILKRLLSGVLLTGSLLVGGLFTQRAIAATGTASDQKSTDLNVDVQEGNDLSLVDPEHPDQLDANKLPGGVKPASNPLSLMYITPELVFGEVQLDQTADLKTKVDQEKSQKNLWSSQAGTNSTNNGKMVIEVGDLRGTLDGWSLGVTATSLKKKGAEQTAIKAASLAFPVGEALSSDKDGAKGATTATAANGATAKSITVNLADGADNSTQKILQAEKGTGYGVTTSQLDPNGIELTLPVKQLLKGTYTSTLTWTLMNA